MNWLEKTGAVISVLLVAAALLWMVYSIGYASGAREADRICYCGRR